MQKRSYCIISLELYMEEFDPIAVYDKLGLRPNLYKHKSAKAIALDYKNWRTQLQTYQKTIQTQSAQTPTSTEYSENLSYSADSTPTRFVSTDSSDVDSTCMDSGAEATEIANEEPKAFYKTHSKHIAPQAFRKECERFIARIDHKQKALEYLKKEHNSFIVLKIHAFINKHDTLALNLSPKVSQVCARLGIRILTHIEILD